MVWRKAWLETRWRFLIGLLVLMCSAAGTVLAYPRVMALMPLVGSVQSGGALGDRIRENADLARDYRGYIWSQWFRQNIVQLLTLFAVMLGTGGVVSHASGGLFTLSLPISRGRLLGVRAATGLAELLLLAAVPQLLLPILSPAVGQSYSVSDALVHGACLFVASAMFFSVACLLSTIFEDVWRPALIALCAAGALALFEEAFRDRLPPSLVHIMSGETYFRGHGVPWLGLIAATLVSATSLYRAATNLARRDF